MRKQITENRTQQKRSLTSFLVVYRPREGERGFTLLLAALVASTVLALGTSIFGLVQKELILSSISRDSQFAFYAADTGVECALYWDVRRNFFATSTPPSIQPTCDGESLCTKPTDSCTRSETYPQTMSFQFEPNGYCVDVSVEKSLAPATGAVRTVVHADGFSRGCDSIATSPRVLQRSVELHY